MMKCPRCVQVIHRGAENCPHCGFTIADADAKFGSEEVRIHRLEDAAGLMRSEERARVEEEMARFERVFPELFFAVYTGQPEGRSDLRQFGFWLLNRAAFEDVGVERPNENGILLMIDPEGKSAGFSWGYGLDAFLTERDTFECLSRAHAYWVEGRFADGVVRAIEQMRLFLVKRHRQVKRDPETYERRVLGRRAMRKAKALRRSKRAAAKEEVER